MNTVNSTSKKLIRCLGCGVKQCYSNKYASSSLIDMFVRRSRQNSSWVTFRVRELGPFSRCVTKRMS